MTDILNIIIASAVSLLVGGGLGWYIKGRGMTGVQIDLNNVKTDVENIKNKVFPSTPAVQTAPVVAPVTNPVMG